MDKFMYQELLYHLMMARGRAVQVRDTVAQNSLKNRLDSLTSFVEYLRDSEANTGLAEGTPI